MSALTWLLILLAPFVVVGAQAVIAAISFGGGPVRPTRRPVFASVVPAGGGWR